MDFPFPWLLTMLIISSYDRWSFAVPFSGEGLLHSLSIFLLHLSFSYWFVSTFNTFCILILYRLNRLQIFTSVLWPAILLFIVFDMIYKASNIYYLDICRKNLLNLLSLVFYLSFWYASFHCCSVMFFCYIVIQYHVVLFWFLASLVYSIEMPIY